MSEALPLRIFLASPSDVDSERRVVRACVDEYNARRGADSNIAYELIGWESVRGTARRPQDAINELIGESHFMIVLFKSSWGTEPGSQWGYTSGTEEELFGGLLALGRVEQPMRDVWVAFASSPTIDERIVALRRQITDRHTLMYEAIDNIFDFKVKLADRLVAWEPFATAKSPRHIDLLPSSGKDVLGAQRLRIDGEKLIELGQADAGAASLREAAILGGPEECLAYARLLARQGDLAGAYVQTQRAIDAVIGGTQNLYSPLAAEAFAAQAGVLRRQSRYTDAIGRLEHALTLLDDADAHARFVQCRIFDELGLSQQATGDLDSARCSFNAALELRRKGHRDADIAQSLVNVARLELRVEDLGAAATMAEQATEILSSMPPSVLGANAEVLIAQIRLRQKLPDAGVVHAERALSMNRQLSSRRGEAIALFLMAQCSMAAARPEEARLHAQACLELNTSIGDAGGVTRAQSVLDLLSE